MSAAVRCPECHTPNEAGAFFCGRCGAALGGPTYQGTRRPLRRITLAGVTMGFALLLILLAVVFTLGYIVYQALDLGAVGEAAPARSGTTATLVSSAGGAAVDAAGGEGLSGRGTALVMRAPSASASSVLKATANSNFRAPNLFDDDLTTAWIEGKEGPGIGEWVRFNFSEAVVLDRLEIANGYQKDDERFYGSIRVKTLRIDYSNGASQLVDLLDTKDMQMVRTLPRPTEWIRLTVVSVHPEYEWEDAALSEVRLYATQEGR